jgi:hypothetical protein
MLKKSSPKSRRRKSSIKKRSRSVPKSRRRKLPIKKRSRSVPKSRRRKSSIKKRSRSAPKSRRRKSDLKNGYSVSKKKPAKSKPYKNSKAKLNLPPDTIKFKTTTPLDMPAKFKKFLKRNNRQLLEKIYTEFLSDEDIYKIFEILFPEPTNQSVDTNVDTNLTACFFVSGHGREGKKVRPTIVKNIIDKFNKFKFNKKIDEEELKEYIKNSVFMIIAMGMLAVSAPMEKEINFGFRPEYTTSELDMVIPKTFFSIFDKYNKDHGNKIKLNNENLDLLHSLIKYQLRVNFYKIWSEPSPIAIEEKTDREVFQVMKRKEIWVLKELTSDSLERTYSLAPNKGEDPEFYAHEGLHIIDIRDTNKQEVTTTDEIKRYNMIEQLNDSLPSANAIRLLKTTFIKGKKRQITEEQKIFDIIMNQIKKTPWIDLSDIIMLGYILNIKKLYIYDPACRPLFKNDEEDEVLGAIKDWSLKRIASFGEGMV